MRQFLNTLYVTLEDAYLSLDGENVVVSCKKAEVGRVPFHTLEGILCFSRSGASPALMGCCARRGIDLCFFSPNGQFLARTVGEERGNVLLRQTQYRIADSETLSCSYAKYFILGKVYNARWVLERATRDHPQRVPVEKLKQVSTQLAAALPLIEQCSDPDQLLGLEGEAAQRYFDCFDALILKRIVKDFLIKFTKKPQKSARSTFMLLTLRRVGLLFPGKDFFANGLVFRQPFKEGVPAPLYLGQFQRIGGLFGVVVASHLQHIHRHLGKQHFGKLVGGVNEYFFLDIPLFCADFQQQIAQLIRPEPFQIGAFPDVVGKHRVNPLNLFLFRFFVQHFHVLLG